MHLGDVVSLHLALSLFAALTVAPAGGPPVIRSVLRAGTAPSTDLGGVGDGVLGVGAVDILAVHVLGLGDEGRATVTAASIALLETEELELLVEEIDEIDHFGGVWERIWGCEFLTSAVPGSRLFVGKLEEWG